MKTYILLLALLPAICSAKTPEQDSTPKTNSIGMVLTPALTFLSGNDNYYNQRWGLVFARRGERYGWRTSINMIPLTSPWDLNLAAQSVPIFKDDSI